MFESSRLRLAHQLNSFVPVTFFWAGLSGQPFKAWCSAWAATSSPRMIQFGEKKWCQLASETCCWSSTTSCWCCMKFQALFSHIPTFLWCVGSISHASRQMILDPCHQSLLKPLMCAMKKDFRNRHRWFSFYGFARLIERQILGSPDSSFRFDRWVPWICSRQQQLSQSLKANLWQSFCQKMLNWRRCTRGVIFLVAGVCGVLLKLILIVSEIWFSFPWRMLKQSFCSNGKIWMMQPEPVGRQGRRFPVNWTYQVSTLTRLKPLHPLQRLQDDGNAKGCHHDPSDWKLRLTRARSGSDLDKELPLMMNLKRNRTMIQMKRTDRGLSEWDVFVCFVCFPTDGGCKEFMTVRVTAVQLLVVGMEGAGGTCRLPSCNGLVFDSSKIQKPCRNLILLQFPQFKVNFINFPNSEFRGAIIPYIRYQVFFSLAYLWAGREFAHSTIRRTTRKQVNGTDNERRKKSMKER